MSASTALPFQSGMPFAGNVTEFVMVGPELSAHQFTGWRHESTAWKDSAYLGASLLVSPTFRVHGPDAKRFLSEHFVNDFDRLTVGGIRHAIMCDEEGRIVADGVILKTGDDDYTGTWLNPAIQFRFESGDYDAVGEDISGQRFLLQVGGPRSLEIVERATGEDLHDLAFARHRESSIGEKPVRVLRLGMAGTLSYEVHGDFADVEGVYEALWAAGREFEMVRLGRRAYMLNHTEDGFLQAYYHYPYPWYEDAAFAAWLDERPGAGFFAWQPRLLGSVGDDADVRYITPFDAGWESRIDWNHDFTGRDALARLAAQGTSRKLVTLEWNGDDVADVYASQFRDGDVFDPMDGPNDMAWDSGVIDDRTGTPRTFGFRADWVLAGDERVGIASGRANSPGYQRMISLAFIDPAYATEGTELKVQWGSPGGPQREIRATVARFPYFDAPNNRDIDTSSIPRLSVSA